MNNSIQNHERAAIDDHPDRLLDLALSELVGGNAPPDLSSRIAAATFRQTAAIAPVPRTRADRAFWVNLAIAVMLLIGVTTVLWPAAQFSRDPANRVVANLTNSNDPKQTTAVSDQVKQSGKINDLVEEFNRLNHQQRYAESEIVARRLNELAPNDPVAQQVWKNSKFIRREMLNHQLADNKESSVWEQLNAVEESKVQPSIATTAPSATAQGQNRPTIATNSYDLGGAKAQTPFPNSSSVQFPHPQVSFDLSETQRVPQTSAAQPVSRPAGPEGSSMRDFYSETDAAAAPGLYGFTDSLGRDRGRSIQISGNALAKSHGTVAPYHEGEAPQTVIASKGRLVLGDAKSVEAEVPGFSTIASDGVKDKADAILRKESTEGTTFSFANTGPNHSGDKYTRIVENPFTKAEGGAAVSTLSIDVDTASYANVRQFLLQMNQLPPPDAVRIEELINYFHYDYAPPISDDSVAHNAVLAKAYMEAKEKGFPPFAAQVEVTACPWAPEHRLARIGIKGREMDRNKRPQSNLVFLVDVSGSMNEPAKLPLVVYGLEQLTRELGENDHIAIVVYAGTEGLVLPSTSGSKQDTILAALAKLQAGGSTAGGAGIQLAYQIAEDNFIKGGTNRVILCTDGDFNVGVTNTADLQRLVEQKAKDTGVFLSTLGFGRGNLNDAMMVAISDHGNGNYHYIDNRTEARRVLVEEMTGTLVTIAKDVKIQVEFNPAQVAGYRLIGYEKRALRTEDFNDDKKDAGEIGAGHTVTALYEIVPAGKKTEVAPVDDLKYQKPAVAATEPAEKASPAMTKELLTLKMRYKAPDGDTSTKLEWPVTDDGKAFSAASGDLKFAASVAGFGLMLRNSQFKGNLTYAATLELAQGGIGEDPHGYRKEFLDMVRKAKELRHE